MRVVCQGRRRQTVSSVILLTSKAVLETQERQSKDQLHRLLEEEERDGTRKTPPAAVYWLLACTLGSSARRPSSLHQHKRSRGALEVAQHGRAEGRGRRRREGDLPL